jgi:hypothetical protein
MLVEFQTIGSTHFVNRQPWFGSGGYLLADCGLLSPAIGGRLGIANAATDATIVRCHQTVYGSMEGVDFG